MSHNAKQHLTLIGISTLLAGFSLASIVNFTDPYSADLATIIFFYTSLFLVALGTFTLLGIGVRRMFLHGLYIVNFGNSFRQAILLSVLIVISLILQARGLLSWWVEMSLILLLAAFEFFLTLKI